MAATKPTNEDPLRSSEESARLLKATGRQKADIKGNYVEQVLRFCFLGVQIEEDPDLDREQLGGAEKSPAETKLLEGAQEKHLRSSTGAP